jgi:translation initiation factor eIF-2B subunit gamma
MLDPINENYPLAVVPIVNKPIIAYQLEYLERSDITNVLVTCERKYSHKIERYLKNHYKSLSNQLNVELVVFHEEEDPINVLKHLQSKIHGDFIVIDGNTLFDIPLEKILDTHTLSGASITTLLKEFDMTKHGKGPKLADAESNDIFGLCSWTDE